MVTILILLIVLWLLGIISGQTFGGFVHVLLVIAIIVFVIDLVRGRA